MNATAAQTIGLIIGALFLLFALWMVVMLLVSNKRDKQVTAALPTLASNEPQVVSSVPVFDQYPQDDTLQRPQTARRENVAPSVPSFSAQPMTRRALRSQPTGLSPTGPVAQPAASRSFFDDDDADFDAEWNNGAGSQ